MVVVVVVAQQIFKELIRICDCNSLLNAAKLQCQVNYALFHKLCFEISTFVFSRRTEISHPLIEWITSNLTTVSASHNATPTRQLTSCIIAEDTDADCSPFCDS